MDIRLDEESLVDFNAISRESPLTSSDSELSTITKDGRRLTVFKINCRHCHHNGRTTTNNKLDRKRLILATVLCSIFMIIEIVGGIVSNSLVIITDAAHLLTDISAFSASLFAMWLSTRSPTPHLNFGYYRAEVLAALFSILSIWLLTGILVYMAINRLLAKDFMIDAAVMVLVAALGILVNLLMGTVLHCNCGFTPVSNLNLKAAFIHVIGDLLQSCAVLIAAIIIYYVPAYKIADPICTLIFSLLVLCTTIKILKDIVQILMEGVPRGIDLQRIQQLLLALPGVVKVYNLRVWALTMEHVALSAHVAIGCEVNSLAILKEATDTIKKNFNIFELTLQIEQYNEDSSDCSACLRNQENE